MLRAVGGRSRAGIALRIALGLVLAAGALAWRFWPSTPAPDWSALYDVRSEPLVLLDAGTVVGTAGPDGWSHLLVKSHPRIHPDDRPRVNSLVARKASFLFTALVADVRPDGGRWGLRAVGVGLGTRVNGADVILAPDRPFGADLDFIDRAILAAGYERQRQGRLVVRSPAFALADAPVHFRTPDGVHRLVAFRYALLVDEPTGRLDALVWWHDPTGAYDRAGEAIEVVSLPKDLVQEPLLHVDTDQFTLGIPSESAFAVDRLPDHVGRFVAPDDLRPLLLRSRYSPEEARRVETALRGLAAE
jgi:hypothetical protein